MEWIAAVACPERVLLLIFTADVEVETLVGEIAIAPGHVDALFAGIATLRDADRAAEVETLDLLLGDDVDHTRDRVGAIGRRRTVAQHLDAVADGVLAGVEVEDVALAVRSEESRVGNECVRTGNSRWRPY